MPNTMTALQFEKLAAAYAFAHDLTHKEAVIALLPDYLAFSMYDEACVDLVDGEVQEWARTKFYTLPSRDRRDIEQAAWEQLEKDRREP